MKANNDIFTITTLAETLAAHRNWTINTTSLRAAGKGTYIADLKRGLVGLTIGRCDRIIQWFSDNWPADLEWPADIPRPKTSKEEAA
jgi:hypothetical protein